MARMKDYADAAPEVVAENHISFDQLLRKFLKLSVPVLGEARRRRFFRATLTRSARKRRGKILEVRKRERRRLEREQVTQRVRR